VGVTATKVPAPILSWAVRPGAEALLHVAREKIETGRAGDRSQLPVPAEHRADVGRMLGVPWELSTRAVTLKTLRTALERAGTTLEAVLVELGGPLRNAAAEKAQADDAEAEQRAGVLTTLAQAGISEPVAVMALRWVGDRDQAVYNADRVAVAWTALPRRPGETRATPASRALGLAEFAGQVLGDPHALDRDTFVGRTLVRCLAAMTALATGAVEAAAADSSAGRDAQLAAAAAAAADAVRAREWRATWAEAGILCDQVSSTVLVLNLPLTGPNPALAQVTRVGAEPLWVTSRMTSAGCSLVTDALSDPLVVRVCENPSVMEAATAELGSSCPPLICLYGRPSSAAWDVLEAVVRAGGRLAVSADRDTAGTQIADEVSRSYPAPGVESWLPNAPGLYEEQRLSAMLADLAEYT
jgi:uncharacterized protein (TIGR02679 family)